MAARSIASDTARPGPDSTARPEAAYEYMSVTQLMWRRFRKHRLARLGSMTLIVLYVLAILADFIAPYNAGTRLKGFKDVPPSRVHVRDESGRWRRPFVYDLERGRHPETFREIYTEVKTEIRPIAFWVQGDPYRFLGLIPADRHLFGSTGENSHIFLFGTDSVSRDLFSRTLAGARVSLFIGFAGVFIAFFLGCLIGGLSGYFGGLVDEGIQRLIDLMISVPALPLWITLSAAIPTDWSVEARFLAITVVLSLFGWPGLARVVRGKLLSLRDLDFVTAARIGGSSDLSTILTHLLPNFSSHLIVSITLAIPGMILGETALSFIGLGMQDPGVSWGVLLQETRNFAALAHHSWKLIPCLFIIVTVLMFNFVGDGLRDAADPYSL